MACYHPVTVHVKKKGLVSASVEQVVPCGSCLGCRADQTRDWSIRIMHEAQVQERAWFLTLTYDDENIPSDWSLDPSHLRQFFDELRKAYPEERIRYYACGEYGTQSERPHYHAVVFGAPFADRFSISSSGGNHYPTWRSPLLESVWRRGFSEIGTVTHASAQYVAGYVRKKLKKRDSAHYERLDPYTGELYDLEPEFSRMSRRPGLGMPWLEKYWKDVYPRDYVVVEGKEFRPPRAYDKWLENHHPELFFQVKWEREKNARYLAPEKLEAKEKIHQSRARLFETRSKV